MWMTVKSSDSTSGWIIDFQTLQDTKRTNTQMTHLWQPAHQPGHLEVCCNEPAGIMSRTHTVLLIIIVLTGVTMCYWCLMFPRLRRTFVFAVLIPLSDWQPLHRNSGVLQVFGNNNRRQMIKAKIPTWWSRRASSGFRSVWGSFIILLSTLHSFFFPFSFVCWPLKVKHKHLPNEAFDVSLFRNLCSKHPYKKADHFPSRTWSISHSAIWHSPWPKPTDLNRSSLPLLSLPLTPGEEAC